MLPVKKLRAQTSLSGMLTWRILTQSHKCGLLELHLLQLSAQGASAAKLIESFHP